MSAIPLGSLGFDPLYLISQIATLQAVYYLSTAAALHLSGMLFGVAPSIDGMFLTADLMAQGATQRGQQYLIYVLVGYVCASLATAGWIYIIVERSKKCLDHACTLYVLHVVVCCLAKRLPTTLTFYTLHAASVACMYFVSYRLCLRREMADVALEARPQQTRVPLQP